MEYMEYMEKEYARMFSIAKLYDLIKESTPSNDVSPFETRKINEYFNRFCRARLPQDPQEQDKAIYELLEVTQAVEENAFVVGFRVALSLMR